MKTLASALVTATLLAGCAWTNAPYLHEAYYCDREYGQAQQHVWDLQVAYSDYRYAEKTPEGLEGIDAELVMDVHNQTFGEKPQEIEVLRFGIVGE